MICYVLEGTHPDIQNDQADDVKKTLRRYLASRNRLPNPGTRREKRQVETALPTSALTSDLASALAGEGALVRCLVQLMDQRERVTLQAVCHHVWGDDYSTGMDNKVKCLIRRANTFLDAQESAWRISRSGKELRRE